MVRTVNIHEAKTHLSRLLEQVAAGDEIVIAKAGKPCARLVPMYANSERLLGFVKGKVTDAFFDDLPAEELAAWE